jgi:hypothetical protein
MDQLTFSLVEPPVSHSQLQESEKDWMTRGVNLPLNISDWLKEQFPGGLSGKTCPESSTVGEAEILVPSSERWLSAGMGGPIEFSTLNFAEWTGFPMPCPSGGAVSSLLDILEEIGDVPHRYYLTPKAAGGILRRAEARGKKLPEFLKTVLLQTTEET